MSPGQWVKGHRSWVIGQGDTGHRSRVATAGVVIDHTEGKDDHTFTNQVLRWWAANGSKFPAWAEAAQIVFAFTPN
jgi:hypothetical protein